MARTGKVKLSTVRRTLRCALAVPSLLLLASCSTPGGEVMIVVTTDMSLPTDLGWVDWTVKRPGYGDERGGHALTEKSLPGTLAIASEKEGGESVTVRLEGRTGDRTGPVRVSREAHFTIPATGLKSLKMPLNWLCSRDNKPQDCGPGMTCEAGQCKSTEITEPLTDYVPLETSPSCFGVLDCTLRGAEWRVSPPNTDPDGHCFMDPNTVPDGPLNVALSLDPGRVGNAGICAESASAPFAKQANHCFVPLDQDEGPDGWQRATDADGQTIIRLPDAVCQAFNEGAINGVVLTYDVCPPKTVDHPICYAAPVCVSTSSSCPSALRPSWSGYSCSGAISPSDDPASGLGYCGVSDNDPEVGSVVRGHLCCTAGQVASTDQLLIDDMSGGPLIKLAPPPGEFPGNWYTASDDTHSPLSPPQTANTLLVYRDVDPVTPPGGPTISRAACFQMREGSTGYYAEEGFSFFSKAAAAVPLDVSPYTGISFWAKVTPLGSEAPPTIRVLFPNRDTDTEHGSSCAVAGVGKSNCNAFGKNLLELTADWKKFSVRWDEIKQADGFGMFFDWFDRHVYSVNFEALRPLGGGRAAPFDFCVSQIYFTE